MQTFFHWDVLLQEVFRPLTKISTSCNHNWCHWLDFKTVIPPIFWTDIISQGTTFYRIQTSTILTNFLPRQVIKLFFLLSLSYQVHNKEEWWNMMLSTLLSPRGGVMKPQVGCTTVHLVRDNKSIKTIMIPKTSYQTSTNKTKPRDASNLWQSFISTIVYRLVLHNPEAAGTNRHSRFICIYHLPRWYVYPRFLELAPRY